ncbi:DNA-directed RNA polymerase sigma-70 factor [Prolixibacter bellariivorans]|uniref:DNA-directed RNA polymerase sigma-70 factor n=2 Tax=Prolixibacter bellariivorans TaxID=314319 RepID=A0A5M4B4H0_9BACT|nr:DNA-directed RNA polymerase sigma-70 factor [Prolixibacter bellariivorans]
MSLSGMERIHILWEQIVQEDDKEAFAELYNLFIDDLYRYGSKLSPDEGMVKDSIQEVFLDLYDKRKKSNITRNLRLYLIVALKRVLIRKLQKHRRLEKRQINDVDMFDVQYSFEEQYMEEEASNMVLEKVKKIITDLPAKQKEIIYLRFNLSLEYAEISSMLGISIESVRKQVYRAIKSVRESIDYPDLLLLFLLSYNTNASSSRV